jgi:hypothetical protein
LLDKKSSSKIDTQYFTLFIIMYSPMIFHDSLPILAPHVATLNKSFSHSDIRLGHKLICKSSLLNKLWWSKMVQGMIYFFCSTCCNVDLYVVHFVRLSLIFHHELSIAKNYHSINLIYLWQEIISSSLSIYFLVVSLSK